MKKKLVLALLVTLLLVFMANFVVYQALVLSLLVTPGQNVLTATIISIILSVLFFPASLIGMKYNTVVTRLLYQISAIWLGFLIYAFGASFLYVAYTAIYGPSPAVAVGFISALIALTMYGVAHARRTKVRKISFLLKDLPKEWKGRTIAFVSDLHFGQVYGKKFAQKVCNKIAALKPDVLFIGGDIYDGLAVDVDAVLEPFSKLLLPLGTYFIMGNHEEFSSNAVYLAALKKAGMNVLLDEKTEIDGLQLIGVDYQTTNTDSKYRSVLSTIELDTSRASILLKHTPEHTEVGAKKGISLQLSGHTHKGQIFPMSILVRILFKEFFYGKAMQKDMHVYTSSGVGTALAPLRVGTNSEIVHITLE